MTDCGRCFPGHAEGLDLGPVRVLDVEGLKVVLDCHPVDDPDVHDQLEARAVGVVAARAFEWPLVFREVTKIFLPDPMAEVGHGQMPVKLSIVPEIVASF